MKNGKIAAVAAMIMAAAAAAGAAEVNFDGRANKDLVYCGGGSVCSDTNATNQKGTALPGGGGHVDTDLTIGQSKAYMAGNGVGGQTGHSITHQKDLVYCGGGSVCSDTNAANQKGTALPGGGGHVDTDQTIQHVKATAGLLKYYKAQPVLKDIVVDFYRQVGNNNAAVKVYNGRVSVAADKKNAYVVQDGRLTTIEDPVLAGAINRAVSAGSRGIGIEIFTPPCFIACMLDDSCREELNGIVEAITD